MKSRNRHKIRPSMTHRHAQWVMLGLTLLFAACDSPVTASEVVSAQIVPTPTHITSTQVVSEDWSTYLMDNEHSGFNKAETIINATTAPALKQHWMYHDKDGISVQPVEANGMIYWGSWDGLEHAMDLKGHQVWATNLGRKGGCIRT